MIARRVLARFLRAKDLTKKRMVVMMGPPAAGKGFFLGEPPPKYGWKLPQMLVDESGNPLLTDEDIPERPAQDESDNHLRAIQYGEARDHFAVLQKAREEGPEAFAKVLADHWYDTKDGGRVELGSFISKDSFPDDFIEFFDETNKDFYVSMRGWHDDARKTNEITGKPTERFKDEARHRFDESVAKKIEQVEDLLIVDSAGEDIDAQDYKGQIEQAKAHGYEVTVIFLHPEQADTELSNMARGKVMGKRMVDQSDISNWYEQNAEALKDIQAAAPDNFVHYRKGPPDEDPKVAMQLRARAQELMQGLASLSGDEKEAAKKEINKTLYAKAPYKLHKPTSYGNSLSGIPDKPEAKDISKTVAEMNVDAQKRSAPNKPEAKRVEKPDPQPVPKRPAKQEPAKPDGGARDEDEAKKTRMNFLREMGDQKIKNPNPESRDRFPQIKIRSLPWAYQKPYYEKWVGKQAATRVVERFLMAAEMKGWLASWMQKLAKDIENGIKIDDYEVSAEPGNGPLVYVTIKGATEDSTTAREVKPVIERLMKSSIKKHTEGAQGFQAKVKAFNKGANLVIECEVVFP